jgi:RNA polymerase sigma-70 factor (ECF subfamily)
VILAWLNIQSSSLSKSVLEIDLVIRSQRGDRTAFDQLLKPKLLWMYTIAVSRVQNNNDAEDVVQESLYRAWKDLPHLKDPKQFHWWLRTIVIHQSQEWLQNRGKNKKVKLYSELTDEEQYMVQEKLQNILTEEVAPNEIIKYIHKLPDKYKEVLYLRFYLGLSWDEISRSLEISIKTVEMRIYRGKKLLMKQLANRMNEFKP